KIKRNYSLTWPEELAGAIIFLASFLAVRNVYALVPFLMALGVASVTAFLALKIWQLFFKRSDSWFHKFNLKSLGTIKPAGWALAGFGLIWIGLNVHSGWIRYHEYGGDLAFQKLQIPDELALAQRDPSQWISPADRLTITEGKN